MNVHSVKAEDLKVGDTIRITSNIRWTVVEFLPYHGELLNILGGLTRIAVCEPGGMRFTAAEGTSYAVIR